jgi:hypothetical protein
MDQSIRKRRPDEHVDHHDSLEADPHQADTQDGYEAEDDHADR